MPDTLRVNAPPAERTLPLATLMEAMNPSIVAVVRQSVTYLKTMREH